MGTIQKNAMLTAIMADAVGMFDATFRPAIGSLFNRGGYQKPKRARRKRRDPNKRLTWSLMEVVDETHAVFRCKQDRSIVRVLPYKIPSEPVINCVAPLEHTRLASLRTWWTRLDGIPRSNDPHTLKNAARRERKKARK